MNPVYRIVGWCDIRAEGMYSAALLDLCMWRGYAYDRFRAEEDGAVTLRFTLATARKLHKDCDSFCIEINETRRGGLSLILASYRTRYGFIAGLLCSVALLILASGVVWDVRVTGNRSVTSSEIKTILDGCGLHPGTRLSGIKADELETAVLLGSDKISWITVNITGTVAEVQVREHAAADTGNDAPADLIASTGGVIESVEIYSGNILVRAGDVVNKGEVLVSGLFDSNTVGMRMTRASGHVMARSVLDFVVRIPYSYDEKQYTGAVFTDRYVNFFGKRINISESTGKEGCTCDTIYSVGDFWVTDADIPIQLVTEEHHAYEYREAVRTPEQAMTLAGFETSRRILDTVGDGMLIGRKTETFITDEEYIMHTVITYIGDIAQVREIQTDAQNN